MVRRFKLKASESVLAGYGNLYKSDFCVTDNSNFAIFYPETIFGVDKTIGDALDFTLNEIDMNMMIDRNETVDPKLVIDRKMFKFVENRLNGEYALCRVNEWFGFRCRLLSCILSPDKFSKPTGVFKIKGG